MSPDDERHGTNPGYIAGCRDTCCRTAAATYSRDLRARHYLHGPLMVPSLGAKRRIQALAALGWSSRALDAKLGKQPTYCAAILLIDGRIRATTHQAIAALYEQLSMTLPPNTTRTERQVATRIRNYARKKGWPPPLAFDNIDDPQEDPATRHTTRGRDVDEAVVTRVLNGEKLPTTRHERDAITDRWLAEGRSKKSLENTYGWKRGRYGTGAA